MTESLGLPRACGDRPVIASAVPELKVSPPRMRGSTFAETLPQHAENVSPAHAGIDLVGSGDAGRRTGLPRACGDRPDAVACRRWRRLSPPRMRGSTCRSDAGGAVVVVSPAHAGIDPPGVSWIRSGLGLPRACGDRP